jgi:hypothetical protein
MGMILDGQTGWSIATPEPQSKTSSEIIGWPLRDPETGELLGIVIIEES